MRQENKGILPAARHGLPADRQGIAALSTVLLVGGVIVEIGVVIGLIAYLVIQLTSGEKYSTQALMAAKSGISDGILKVVRNKNIDYTSSGSPYSITVSSNSTVTVSICKNSKTVTTACDTATSGKDEITSLGASFNRQHKLVAILNVDSTTGYVRVESIQEVPLQ